MIGLFVGWILDGIIATILAMLYMSGHGLGFTLLVYESKIILLILALIIFFVSKNKEVKLVAIGTIIYAVVIYLFFKLYFIPESMNKINEMFGGQLGQGNPENKNITELLKEANSRINK